jgi:2-C-methyl-D-erythritol 4-phosphate cytidylyltransferase / 2-C-methyl-D-erythritol 2,4-cyclodiphosphate synthase
MIHTLIVAAGRGARAGAGLPKQYRNVQGEMVLRRTIKAFLPFSKVTCVIHQDDLALYSEAVRGLIGVLPPVFGGETRQISVYNGLKTIKAEHILIHDGARCFVSSQVITRAIDALKTHEAAIPTTPVTDTIRNASGIIPRETLHAVQTPQAFHTKKLLQAYEITKNTFTDDASLFEAAGGKLYLFSGDPANIKLTYEKDFMRMIKVGQGYDVHAFGEGDHVMLGGIRVPHTKGVMAHSDGDVILHALTDAILGVLGDGDIGTHFPPSDMRWKGASSDQFLKHACDLLAAKGGKLNHLDVTLVCETPKVTSYREAIRARIAEIAGVRVEDVGIKATTSEKMGFTGRGEGLAALALVTVEL